ncbi:MAG TPA: type II toxin-antitoxin system VapC family toxin, partial [Chitinophagaceae bacterium]|nr:type II toxin-antitoxin system VapC family toxin [Chitinophagaceae bacterium]
IIKQKPVSVLEKFSTLSPGQIGLSVITVAELEYGARKSLSIEKNLSSLRQFLIPFDIFSFDFNATIEYGIIRNELEAKGMPIGPLDTLIAAHAKSLNYILVTNNEKEFKRVSGIQIENWAK